MPPESKQFFSLPLKRTYSSFLEDPIDQCRAGSALNPYCPQAVDNSVTRWIDSISESNSHPERRSRSIDLSSFSHGDQFFKRRIKSAPSMDNRPDADEFAVPTTPTQSGEISDTASSEDNSGRWLRTRLVETPLYRVTNLASNNIYLCSRREQVPEHISSLIARVGRDRDSPGPSADYVRQDEGLEAFTMGAGEPDVEEYFKDKIFPKPKPSDILKRTDRYTMAKQVVPDSGSKFNVSTPIPDMLFGYSRNGAFSQLHQTQLLSMGNQMVVNSQDLIFPFFVIEFEADGASGVGSMWVATNQCLGGSASCLNIVERLNHQLRQCTMGKNLPTPNDNAAFSIALNGTEA